MTQTIEAPVIQDHELLIERTFDASPDLVFRVWTKPEHLMRWWGPKDFTTPTFEMDFRAGGAYRACIRDPEGNDHWMSGVYQVIVPARRIVMTFRWEDSEDGPYNLVTVGFEAAPGGRTKFSFHQATFADVATRDSHVGGWTECIDRMAAHLETAR